ncbi:MAG: hypothetical protein Q9163_005379 [Psora crenata]
MVARMTRAAAAREASFASSDKKYNTPQCSNPPITSGPAHSNAIQKATSKKCGTKKQSLRTKADVDNTALPPTPTSAGNKTTAVEEVAAAGETKGRIGEGKISSFPVAPGGKKRKRTKKVGDNGEYAGLPHNIGHVPEAPGNTVDEDGGMEQRKPQKEDIEKKSVPKQKAETESQSAAMSLKDRKDAERAVLQLANVKAKIAEEAAKREKAIETGKKTKSESYGLCEGETPFPRWPRPTPEECQEVHDILLKHHPGVHPQPKTIPPPSEFIAGCGEVRSILDALVRTRLSASTTGSNSNAAYQGMVKRYGILKSGVGKGSVDYNAVRLAPVQDLFYAIKIGGLAVSKSADIKALLDLVYEENQARRQQLLTAQATNEVSSGPKGADTENDAQKAVEIKLAEEENLSLDHFYTLPTYDAIYKFMTYPGIGVKTAACVAMFCMQRPCFAVDTHVFRLAKWLGWVPPPEEKVKGDKTVDRDTTFSHLEVRVPDRLKYMLHQLFLQHGKSCPRCRGNTGESSADWGEGCVIDHLVERTGPRKGGDGGIPAKAKKTKRSPRGQTGIDSDEVESENETMPDLHDDDTDSPTNDETINKEAMTRAKCRPSVTKTTAKSAPCSDTGKATIAKVATASFANRTAAAASQPKRKPTPTNGWKGGKAIRAEAASKES